MGTSSSAPEKEANKQQLFEAEYQFISSSFDERYGEVKIMKHHKTQEMIAVNNRVFNSEASFKRTLERFKRSSSTHLDYIVKFLRYQEFVKEEFCGSFWKLQVVYEYLTNTLEKDMSYRGKNQARINYYTEEEIWFILKSVLLALNYLNKNNILHGDIRPSNILISTVGKIKLIDYSLLPPQNNSYANLLLGSSDKIYFSPQILMAYKNKAQQPDTDIFKSDLFSLGMVGLEAATFMKPAKCYDLSQHFSVNTAELKDRLTKVSSRYSSQLSDFLGALLTLDENARPSLNDFLRFIEDYERRGFRVSNYLLFENHQKYLSPNKDFNYSPLNFQQRRFIEQEMMQNANNSVQTFSSEFMGNPLEKISDNNKQSFKDDFSYNIDDYNEPKLISINQNEVNIAQQIGLPANLPSTDSYSSFQHLNMTRVNLDPLVSGSEILSTVNDQFSNSVTERGGRLSYTRNPQVRASPESKTGFSVNDPAVIRSGNQMKFSGVVGMKSSRVEARNLVDSLRTNVVSSPLLEMETNKKNLLQEVNLTFNKSYEDPASGVYLFEGKPQNELAQVDMKPNNTFEVNSARTDLSLKSGNNMSYKDQVEELLKTLDTNRYKSGNVKQEQISNGLYAADYSLNNKVAEIPRAPFSNNSQLRGANFEKKQVYETQPTLETQPNFEIQGRLKTENWEQGRLYEEKLTPNTNLAKYFYETNTTNFKDSYGYENANAGYNGALTSRFATQELGRKSEYTSPALLNTFDRIEPVTSPFIGYTGGVTRISYTNRTPDMRSPQPVYEVESRKSVIGKMK